MLYQIWASKWISSTGLSAFRYSFSRDIYCAIGHFYVNFDQERANIQSSETGHSLWTGNKIKFDMIEMQALKTDDIHSSMET